MTAPLPFPMGNTAADVDDIIIDSAVAWQNGSQLAPTRGSLSFDPGEEWENYSFPGKTGPVAGLDEVVRSRPTIKGTMMLTGEAQFTVYRPGGTWSDGASAGGVTTSGIRTFTPGAFRASLNVGSYLENFIVFWKRQGGDYIAVEFRFALCTHYNIDSKDGDEGTIAVEFEAVQPNDATPPYSVYTLPPSAPPPPDPGDIPGGDLPEGGDLGFPILDLNAETLLALGVADNTTVPSWVDDTGITGNGTPYAPTTQTAPTFRTSGFAGGSLPYVSVSGTQGWATPIPVVGDGTYYFVVNITSGAGTEGDGDGVGNAAIMLTQSANASNGWVSVRADGKLQTGVNVGSGGFFSTTGSVDRTDGPHIIRLARWPGGGSYYVYVDGVLESSATGQAVLNNSWAGLPRMYYGNVTSTGELVADYGRVVVYDDVHLGAGPNAVELALKAIWGTP
jgi:hypothetical protein